MLFNLTKFFFALALLIQLAMLKTEAAEFSLVAPQTGGKSISQLFDELRLPNLRQEQSCVQKNEQQICTTTIFNQGGRALFHATTPNTVSVIASGRYQAKALMMLEHVFKNGDETKTEYFFVDDQGTRSDYRGIADSHSGLASIVTPDAHLLAVRDDGLYRDGQRLIEAPSKVESVVFGTNPTGAIAILANAEDNHLYWSDVRNWTDTGLEVPSQSDRMNTLAIYPSDNNETYGAFYQYASSYNKGLRVVKFNGNKNVESQGWLFNSDERNVGFDPVIYTEQQQIIISAEDSTNRQRLHFQIPYGTMTSVNPELPDIIDTSRDFRIAEVLVGGTVSYQNWQSQSTVKQGDKELFKVDYDIASTYYKGYFFQGRIYNTQLAVSYLQNEAETKGTLTKRASEIINALVDFNGLFSPRSTLRFAMEQAQVNGVAEPNKTPFTPSEFTTKYEKYSVLVMMERGTYIGGQYATYNMPSAIGFSDVNKTISSNHIFYDTGASVTNVSLMLGYDEIHYAQRYENDLNRLYITGLLNLGLGSYNLSDSITQQLEQEGKKPIYPLTFVINLGADIGYIYQNRARTLGGAGFSIALGYRANFGLIAASQSKDPNSTIGQNELELETGKVDFWHGPFANLNFMY